MKEIFAEKLHSIWSSWFNHLYSNCDNEEHIKKWTKQSQTEYHLLSEEDKEKDRKIYDEHFHPIVKSILISKAKCADKTISPFITNDNQLDLESLIKYHIDDARTHDMWWTEYAEYLRFKNWFEKMVEKELTYSN